jgi:hypothetical protein
MPPQRRRLPLRLDQERAPHRCDVAEFNAARRHGAQTGRPARRFKDFKDREGAQRAMAVLDEQEDQALAAQEVAAITIRRIEPEPVAPPRYGDEQQKRRPRVEGGAVQDLSPW